MRTCSAALADAAASSSFLRSSFSLKKASARILHSSMYVGSYGDLPGSAMYQLWKRGMPSRSCSAYVSYVMDSSISLTSSASLPSSTQYS